MMSKTYIAKLTVRMIYTIAIIFTLIFETISTIVWVTGNDPAIAVCCMRIGLAFFCIFWVGVIAVKDKIHN